MKLFTNQKILCQINFRGLIPFLGISIILLPLADSYSNNQITNSRHCTEGTCRPGHSSNDENRKTTPASSSKLLIILIDGFRWDYYTRQKSELPGLSHFMSNSDGVRAEWVEPIFPSMSFPSWTTIATGVYPEEHNILGNYMLYRPSNSTMDEMSPVAETVFHLKDNSTKSAAWWQSAEPIWTAATRRNLKVYLANWARCDVPYHNILPTECTGYMYQEINMRFRDDLQNALKRFQNGFSLAMVYDDLIDHAGHKFGPDSNELKLALIHRDTQIHELLMNIRLSGLANKINIVITSDHGMTNLNQTVRRVYLQKFLDMNDVHRIVDYGPVVGIAAMPNRTDALAEQLNLMPGVLTYSKANIPEEFHYKRGKFVLDFLLVAKPGNFIVGVKGEKQIPENDEKASSDQPYAGVHGYYNMTDMRTLFFAKGPAFKKGRTTQPIRLVDQYQIFMKVLGLSPNPHHGNWDSVKDMFDN